MIFMGVCLWLGGACIGFAIGVRLTAKRYRRALEQWHDHTNGGSVYPFVR